jgi:hypothetical protein
MRHPISCPSEVVVNSRAEYGFIVSVEKIRPMGRINYAAKISKMVRYVPGGSVPQSLAPFCEYWGETEDEAEGKANAAATAWVAEQGGVVTWQG